MTEQITHTGPLWRWSGGNGGAWHFVSIDGAAGEALSATALMRRLEKTLGGFGSLKVQARIGVSAISRLTATKGNAGTSRSAKR